MKYIFIFLLLILISGCDLDLLDVPVPSFEGSSIPDGATAVPEQIRTAIEGIYTVQAGSKNFGDRVVLKWNGSGFSIFCGKNANYVILESAIWDTTFYFEGYWRSATSSKTGLAKFQITAHNGAHNLLKNIRPDSIIIEGFYDYDNKIPTQKFILKRERLLKKSDPLFYIIAHRGGGRTIDRLPYSENSLGMLSFAEKIGANAVELDVQRTRDGVLVLFHDAYMSKRLVNEDYFIGKISDYTFAQLSTFCTLIDGQKIPTLEKALQTIIQNTQLRLVWLDLKEAKLLPQVVELQTSYLQMARNNARDLEIIIGIANKTILKAFLDLENYAAIPSLCELKVADVRASNALIWAPRWSAGLQNDLVDEMHSAGKRAFSWTLDDQIIIKSYIKKAHYDGFVSNYPGLVTYEYYTAE